MTICVSVKVSEGLVLAADSIAAVQGNLRRPDGVETEGILKTYDHARKVSHIKDYPIGTLSWGISLIGSRSVESLIKEFEYNLPSMKEEDEKARLGKREGRAVDHYQYKVKDIALGLLNHIRKYYLSNFENMTREKLPNLGLLVSGYSSGEFFPEQWLIDLPNSDELIGRRQNLNGKPDFGADWFGLTDAMTRLHWGRDDKAIQILSEHFNTDPKEILNLLVQLQYPIIFDGMPLQDAIDFAVYVINVVIGRFRFVVGAPLCGGEIDVAVITPDDFTWIHRKSWKVKGTISI